MVEPMEPFPYTRTLIEDKGDRGSAMSFFAKLLKPLRDQMKASGDTLPEDRRQMVAKAQRAWEATLKKGRPNQNQSANQPRRRSHSPRHKSHSRRDYRDRSRSRHHHKSHRERESYRDNHKDYHKDYQERKNRPEDRSRQDPKDHSNNSRCYSCGESGHYSNNCPKKQKRVHAIRHRSNSQSSSSSSASSRAKSLSPSSSDLSKK